MSDPQTPKHLVTCATVTFDAHPRRGEDCLWLQGIGEPEQRGGKGSQSCRVLAGAAGVASSSVPAGLTAKGVAGSARLAPVRAACGAGCTG